MTSNLTDVELTAIRHWKEHGGHTALEMAQRILASRHQEESYMIFQEVKDLCV